MFQDLQSAENSPSAVIEPASLSVIDESWKESWGASIKSKKIRSAIEATSRLADRLKQKIVDQAGLEFGLEPSNVNTNTELLYDQLPEKQKTLVSTYINTSRDIIFRQIGLILFSSTIKSLLNSRKAQDLIKSLHKEDIRFALDFLDFSLIDYGLEPVELQQQIDKVGHTSIFIWAQSFPSDIALDLMIRIPKIEISSEYLSDKEAVTTAVEMVLERNNGS
ncbi:MAG: hypothetical protein AAF228_07985 [Pseudomonadota bacterium]